MKQKDIRIVAAFVSGVPYECTAYAGRQVSSKADAEQAMFEIDCNTNPFYRNFDGEYWVYTVSEFDRMAWGTATNRWHLIGKSDRDYETAITLSEYIENGDDVCREKYLSPRRI